jgi:hypothetical protein
MFIDNNYINITIFYKKTGMNYIAFLQKDFNKKVPNELSRKKFLSVTIKLKPLTWGIYNDINNPAILKSEDGDRGYDYKSYKEHKLKTIIVDWDVKKKNNKGELEKVTITDESILSIAPEIAELILKEYDEVTMISEEEEKKIIIGVHNFVMNGRGNSSIARAIMENELIEDHHWLPQDIEKIPYKSLMKYYLIRRTRSEAKESKLVVDKFKREQLKK